MLAVLLVAAAIATPMNAADVGPVVETARRAGGTVVVAARGPEAERALDDARLPRGVTVRRIAAVGPIEREVEHLLRYQGATCVITVAPLASRLDVRAAGACGTVTVDRLSVEGAPASVVTGAVDRSTLGPLGFSRVAFRIAPGSVVGRRTSILAPREPLVTWTWDGGLAGNSDALGVQALDRLKQAGFPTRGAEDLVFGQSRGGEARFLLGGEVSAFSYDHEIGFGSQRTRARIQVTWQVFDPRRQEVVFTRAVEGTLDESEAIPPEAAVTRTLLASLDAVSADPAFTAALTATGPVAAPAAEPLPLPACPAPARTLPADLPRVLEATVTLRRGAATGVGFLVSPQGHVLTAAHVVGDGQGLVAVLPGGFSVPATRIRADTAHDVAVVQVPGQGTACLPLATTEPAVGASIYAVGLPLGEGPLSVSRGIVSGIRVDGDARYLQTDASINPGNSGGPLVDERGVVVGIVSFKVVGAAVEGLGFGIPAPSARTALGLVEAPAR